MTARWTRNLFRLLPATLLVVAVATSCGTATTPMAGTSDAAGVPSSLADALGAQFGACSQPPGEASESTVQFLEDVSGWIHVASVVQATRQPDGGLWTFPAVVRDPSGSEHNIRIHTSFWGGVDWGLSNGGQVWFAMADKTFGTDLVAYVVVIAPDSSVFFPGECNDGLIRQLLADKFGSNYNALVAGSLGKSGVDLQDVYASAASASVSTPPTPAITLLNPENVSPDFLSSLQPIVLHFRLSQEISPGYTICTKTSAGWNDCLKANDAYGGLTIPGYVASDGGLQVWLCDSTADLANPIRSLGHVVVPPSLMGESDIGLDIAVAIGDTSDPSTAVQGDGVSLLDAVPAGDIASQNWSGRVGGVAGGGSTGPATPGNE